MCRCGHHPQAYLNTSPSLSQMTTHDVMDLIEKWGYKSVKISDDGIGRVNITTETPLTKPEQRQIEACMPAGVIVLFTTSIKTAQPVPKQLEKWFNDTKRYMK